MKSVTLFTEEIDDIEAALQDLLNQLENFSCQKNTIGLLFVPTETDLSLLTASLEEELHFPVMGATGSAILNDKCGYQSGVLSLQIMTADDCTFTAGITGTLTEENFVPELDALCRQLLAKSPAVPQVAITYFALQHTNITAQYMQIFSSALPNVPVYGGIAAADLGCENGQICFGTEICHSGALVLLVSGAVNPILQVEFSISQQIPLTGEAICHEGSVQKIGDKSLLAALKRTGIQSKNSFVLPEFLALPFQTQLPVTDDDSISVVRLLAYLDQQAESGTFLGDVCNGCRFSVGLLKHSDIRQSIEQCFAKLQKKIAATENYTYSTILCTSCAAREIIMTGDAENEGDFILPLLPEGMTLNGFYAFGEFCPATGQTGKIYNAFHTTSFTILAM